MTSHLARITLPAESRVGMRFGTEIDHGVAQFAQGILARHGFDPTLVEAVRLRCAATHDCRACLSLRSTDVVTVAEDELPERARVAVRFTDAMLATPVHVDHDLKQQVRDHFTDAEVAQLAFLVMKWAHQKVHVALRIEPPIRSDSLSEVTFTRDGRTIVGDSVGRSTPST